MSFARSRWLRIVLIAIAVIAVVVGAFYASLTPVARWQIETQLEALGARSVEVGEVHINPTKAEIEFRDFRAVGPDGREMSIEEGRLVLNVYPLTRRNVAIQLASVRGADITIRRLEGGHWTLGGLPVSFGGESPADSPNPESGEPWQIDADDLIVESGKLTLEMGERVRVANIKQLRIRNLTTLRPDEPAKVNLDGQTAEGNIAVSGEIFPFAKHEHMKLDIDISEIVLGEFDDLLVTGRMRAVKGTIRVKGRLEAGEEENNTSHIAYEGEIGGDELEFRTGLFRTKAFSLSWNGAVDFRSGTGPNGEAAGINVTAKAEAKSFEFENLASKELLSAGTATFDLSENGLEIRPDIDGKGTLQIAGTLDTAWDYARFVQPDAGLEVAPRLIVWNGTADVRLPAGSSAMSATLSGEIATEKFWGSMRAAGIDVLNANAMVIDYDDAEIRFDGEGGMSAEGTAKINSRGLEIRTPRNGFSATFTDLETSGTRGKVERTRNGNLDIALDGPMKATGLKAEGTDGVWETQQEAFDWKGLVEVGGRANGDARWRVDGSLQNTQARFAVPAIDFALTVDTSSWTGEARGSTEQNSLVVQGESRVTGMEADVALPEKMHFSLGEVATKAIDLKDGRFAVGEAAIRAFEGKAVDESSDLPVAKLGALIVKDVSLSPEGRAEIGSVDARGGEVQVVRGQDGSIVLPGGKKDESSQGGSQESTQSEQSSAEQKAIAGSLSVGTATITDGTIAFTDRSVSPEFKLRTSKFNAKVEQFDTAEPNERADVTMNAEFADVGRLDVKGSLAPDTDNLNTQLQITFRNLELVPFNPYIEEAVGRGVRQGRANGDIDLKIANDRIDAQTQVMISRLQLRRNSGKSSGGPPIETAIDLLQNDDREIKLSIPVSGSLDDPQFDLSDAISQAMSNALKDTVMTAAKIAFPLGAVIAIIDDSGKTEFRIRPLVFSPGNTEMTPALEDRVAEVARYLKQKEDGSPALCGFATQEDIAFLKKTDPNPTNEAAIFLAQQRAQTIRDALVEQHNISPDRLFGCSPELDKRDGAVPRVSVRF